MTTALPNLSSSRLLLAVGACALTFALAACSNDLPPDNIPPNASSGPGNAFVPGDAATAPIGADTGFPSKGGGNGANAPGH